MVVSARHDCFPRIPNAVTGVTENANQARIDTTPVYALTYFSSLAVALRIAPTTIINRLIVTIKNPD